MAVRAGYLPVVVAVRELVLMAAVLAGWLIALAGAWPRRSARAASG